MAWLRLTRVRGVPLAGEALGFAAIVRGQPTLKAAALLDRTFPLVTGHS